MAVYHGESISRIIEIFVEAPQGSVLAATLFRLHIHLLPKLFFRFCSHLFADDLAIVLKGSLEKRLSDNIIYLEEQAKVAMKELLKFSIDMLQPVNVAKTKVMLVHDVVAPTKPNVFFDDKRIDYVKYFKYLGVEIRTKLGWGEFIKDRLAKIRKNYAALKLIYRIIPVDMWKIRRKLFCAFALPHFLWLFTTWFFFTERQRLEIEHVYCSGLRLIYTLWGWDDYITVALTKERTILDYVSDYWKRLIHHMEHAAEAISYRETWEAYLTATSPDRVFYKSMGFRKNSVFPKRLALRAHHTNLDVFSFLCEYAQQKDFFRSLSSDFIREEFEYKYLHPP